MQELIILRSENLVPTDVKYIAHLTATSLDIRRYLCSVTFTTITIMRDIFIKAIRA